MTTEAKKSNRGSKPGERRGGRVQGTPNKVTQLARESIALFVEGNVDRLTGWLDKIAEDSPDKAFSAFMSVVEYHIPKLARTEQTGAAGGPMQIDLNVTFGK